LDYITKKAETLLLAYEQTSDKKYLQSAITDYESLMAKMPNNNTVLNNLAYLLAENDQNLADALKYAKRALDAQPNEPGFLDTYAYVLYKSGNYQEAVRFVDAALQQYSQRDQMFVPAEVYEHKGLIKERLGAKDEAIAAYKQALEAAGTKKSSQKVIERINKAVERISQ
jgi:tetratricopeptide (TPR) repeat protein